MEVLYLRCAGLDVHKDTVVACVRILQDGKVDREVRTFKTVTRELLALSEWLAGHGCTHIVMEATGIYWRPVWHILGDGEFELLLANAAHVKNVPGRKTDVNDATWLADLLAHGALVRGSFVPDDQTQELRGLLPHAQAVRPPNASRPYAAPAEDARGRQRQARLGDQRHRRTERPAHDRGAGGRRERPDQAGAAGPSQSQGLAAGAML